MQAKHVWTFCLRSMKPLAQRVIGLELVMNGHLIAKREPAMKSNAAMGTSGKLSLLLVLRPPAVHIGRPAFRGWRQRYPSSEATAVLG